MNDIVTYKYKLINQSITFNLEINVEIFKWIIPKIKNFSKYIFYF